MERNGDAGKGLRPLAAPGLPLKTGSSVIEIDPRYFRPTEVDFLLADPSYAKKKLGWVPKITFADLVKVMTDADLELAGLKAPGESRKILHDKGIHWTANTQV